MYTVILVLNVAVFLLVGLAYVRIGPVSIYHPLPTYMAFHGLVFVVRPILAYIYGFNQIYTDYHFHPSLSDKVTVIAASALGLVVFAFFSMRSGNVPMVFRSGPVQLAERSMLRKTLPVAMAICLPLGFYSLLATINEAATVGDTMVMQGGVVINTTSNGYLHDAMMILIPSCGLFAWFHRFKLYSFLPLAVFFVLKASTGSRGPFILACAGAGFFYFYDKRIRLPGAKLMLLAAFLAGAFSFVGADRGMAVRDALGITKVGQERTAGEIDKQRFLESMDYGNMEFFEYLVYAIPQRTKSYDYFLSNLQILTEPVPRSVWSGKPIGPPIKLFDLWDYGTPVGITFSLPGVGWYELGWFGVVIWCGLWGWGLGRFYRWFVNGPQDTMSTAIYMVSFPLLVLAYRDGALLTVIRTVAFYAVPLLLIILMRKVLRLPTFREMAIMMMRMRGRAAQAAAGAAADAAPAPAAAPVMGRGKANRLRLIAGMKRSPAS